mmetsp:Transcript_36455/g.74213  ORF Transcript_36455/g.74213 Transcript_36455/m.74213 type:complete len:121 (+) Transcript_36455:369-731(+)
MSKLFGSTENLEEGFPALPRWFWRACGGWIILALVLYDMGVFGLGRNHVLLKEISALMETIFVGGIFYSIFFIKNMSGSNAIAQTKGFVLVPVSLRRSLRMSSFSHLRTCMMILIAVSEL